MVETYPVFPLPETVLFPRTHLRLHLFEPRYVALMDHVMATTEHFAMAHLKPGYEKDYYGAPPIYKTLTTARVLVADKQSDGRWYVLVEGMQRARLIDEVASEPYRVMRMKPMLDIIPPEHHAESMRLMEVAARRAEALAVFLENGQRSLSNLVNTHQHPSIVADVIAAMTVVDSYTRQSLLEENDVHRRLRLLLVTLDEVISQLKERGVELNLPATEVE